MFAAHTSLEVTEMIKVPATTTSGSRIWLSAILLILLLVPSGGCRICAQCDDLAYPAYGGAWQRTRRDGGRVGSIFDPGGARSSELVSRDQPDRPDERERQRQTEEGSDSSLYGDSEDGRSQQDDEDSSQEKSLQERRDELRERSLDDIEIEGEKELREQSVDDIEVKIVPGQPAPPVLR